MNKLIVSWSKKFDSWHNSLIKPTAKHSKPLIIIYVSAVSLMLIHFFVLSKTFQSTLALAIVNHFPFYNISAYSTLVEGIMWSLGCFFFYLIVPGAIIKIYFHENLKDYGLTFKGYFKHLKWYLLLFIPVFAMVILVSFQPSFQYRYPFYHEVRGMSDLLVWELFYGIQFISLEFFFRGFLVHGLKEKLGAYSVFLMVIPYMMLHYQKPFLECAGAIIAGTVLGFLSLGTGSVFGGATIHIFVAFSMDLMALYQKGFFS